MATKRKGTVQEQMEEITEKKESPVKAFNFQEYQIAASPEARTVVIEETGDEFEVKIKPLSWSRRNQILSKSLKWSDTGQTNFDGDSYVRACLKEMVVDAPWGSTSEAFLISIDERLGNALETLVPSAFGTTDSDEITLEDTDKIKNE